MGAYDYLSRSCIDPHPNQKRIHKLGIDCINLYFLYIHFHNIFIFKIVNRNHHRLLYKKYLKIKYFFIIEDSDFF